MCLSSNLFKYIGMGLFKFAGLVEEVLAKPVSWNFCITLTICRSSWHYFSEYVFYGVNETFPRVFCTNSFKPPRQSTLFIPHENSCMCHQMQYFMFFHFQQPPWKIDLKVQLFRNYWVTFVLDDIKNFKYQNMRERMFCWHE